MLSQGDRGTGDGISRAPSLSDDGGVVAFQSTATNLSAAPTSGQNDTP